MVLDGTIGELVSIRVDYGSPNQLSGWRLDRDRAGGGVVFNVGIHLIDLVRWTCGDVRRVVAHAGMAHPRTVPGGTKAADAEDYATVLAELTSGAHATLLVSRAAHGRNEHTLEIYGTRGALAYRLGRDTPRWYAKLQRKDYTIGLNVTGVSVDDPDGNIVENYSCNSERNYTQYCNADVDKLLAAQSRELDKEKRRKLVRDIEKILVDDAARPVILHGSAGNCWQPYVKNFKPHDNSQYNNLRFEDVWLDK